jgi:monoamine oxidase
MSPSPSMEQCLQVVRTGLPRTTLAPKRIAIVGAGMAGLVAGVELMRAGHDVVILEASQRVGGRVRTLRAPFSSGLYGEAGAMRIPLGHQLTVAYVKRYQLPTEPFHSDHPRAFYHFFGQTVRREDALKGVDGPRLLAGLDASVPDIMRRWENLVRPIAERLAGAPEDSWLDLLGPYESMSTRAYLVARGWSDAAIEAFGLLFNQESLLGNAFVEVLIEEARGAFGDLVQIAGGMDRLPLSLGSELGERVRFGEQVVAVEQDGQGATVRSRSRGGTTSQQAQRVILTLPFSVLRYLDFAQPLSLGKQSAIRELHYDAATKIFAQCARRFWEADEGILGGRSVTDLPIRTIYYPEHGRDGERGVLLVSYTWGEDAERWGALPQSQRIALAMQQATRIHAQLPATVEASASAVWSHDAYTIGAFADFMPGQQSRLYPHIVQAEGRLHFAGEHASLAHAWIQGAIQSGIRAAWEAHFAP